MIDAKPIRHGL